MWQQPKNGKNKVGNHQGCHCATEKIMSPGRLREFGDFELISTRIYGELDNSQDGGSLFDRRVVGLGCKDCEDTFLFSSQWARSRFCFSYK